MTLLSHTSAQSSFMREQINLRHATRQGCICTVDYNCLRRLFAPLSSSFAWVFSRVPFLSSVSTSATFLFRYLSSRLRVCNTRPSLQVQPGDMSRLPRREAPYRLVLPPLPPACAVFSACVVPSRTSSPPKHILITSARSRRFRRDLMMSEGVFLRVRAATTSGALQASACLRLAPFSSLLKAVLSHFWRCGLLGCSATAFGAVCVLPPGGTSKAPRARLPASIASRTAPAVALALLSYATCRSPLTLVLSNLDTMCLGARLPHSGLLHGASLPRSPQTLGSSSSSHGPFWVLCGPGALRSPGNLWVQDAGRS